MYPVCIRAPSIVHSLPVADYRLADIEIVRQQWHFSPGGSTFETEDYQVDLPGLSVLELSLDPDLASDGVWLPNKATRFPHSY